MAALPLSPHSSRLPCPGKGIGPEAVLRRASASLVLLRSGSDRPPRYTSMEAYEVHLAKRPTRSPAPPSKNYPVSTACLPCFLVCPVDLAANLAPRELRRVHVGISFAVAYGLQG